MKIWMKACPHCGGDLQLRSDLDGPYVQCLQCGTELTRFESASLVREGCVKTDKCRTVAPPVEIEGRRRSA